MDRVFIVRNDVYFCECGTIEWIKKYSRWILQTEYSRWHFGLFKIFQMDLFQMAFSEYSRWLFDVTMLPL